MSESAAGPYLNLASAVNSGQGLQPLLTDESLTIEKGETSKTVRGCRTLLILEEWTTLVRAGAMSGSTLFEELNKLLDGKDNSSSHTLRAKGSGQVTIKNPALSILGATTFDSFAEVRCAKIFGSGFFNRWRLAPGSADWEPYTGQAYRAPDTANILADLNTLDSLIFGRVVRIKAGA